MASLGMSPIHSAVLVQIIPTVVIAIVPASSLWVRRFLLGVDVILTLHVIQMIHTVVENYTWRTTLAATTAILLFRSCDVILLSCHGSKDIPIRLDAEYEETVDPRAHSLLDTKIVSAWRLLWNMRGIQTSWVNRDIPPFSSKDEDYVPSRSVFLLHNVAKVAVLAVLIDVFASTPPYNVQDNYSIEKQRFIGRLQSVDREEILLRAAAVVGFWVNITCYISVMYSSLAVFFVGIGLDEPVDWPPCFGSLSNGWSIRRFWGLTWHQTLRSLLGSNCDALLLSIFKLPRRAFITYYLRVTFSFALSGLLHHVVDMKLDIPGSEAGMVTFFMMQPLGMIIEDLVIWTFQKIGVRKLNFMTTRILGYLWLSVWLFWVTPGIFYPYIRLGDRSNLAEHRMMPFSVVDLISEQSFHFKNLLGVSTI